MASPKDVLVLTTSSVDGLKIQKYLKPISAHIVAGTNLFSDFLGGLTDVFGGRSDAYQKQLTSLYNEAIDRIKFSAYEIGGNCVIGLSINMDEISGKGKSMFMLTAVGTAVIIEREITGHNASTSIQEKYPNVSVERILNLRTKREILEKAAAGNLVLKEDIWNFITSNQVEEVFPYLLKKFSSSLTYDAENSKSFHLLLTSYIGGLSESKKLELIYEGIQTEKDEKVILKLSEIVKELYLFDFIKCTTLIQSEDFSKQKIGLRIARYDKLFYNKRDIQELLNLKELVNKTFFERGTRALKKQLLSSKEKEVWTCECGKTNDIGEYCTGCERDIYGFKANEVKPSAVENFLQQKIELIAELAE